MFDLPKKLSDLYPQYFNVLLRRPSDVVWEGQRNSCYTRKIARGCVMV